LVLPLFLRDPISGYAILVLAAIVIAFIAYPLLKRPSHLSKKWQVFL